ncbi:hypothetical protein FLONG3_11129 [Fusarium longipes]|uniref:Uncharacterized protein n=1 Tax=Fusarium longipes TaxID=694270 RepID=A0A395RHQ0_9HYPO|nr:hypothetical protein FLONG3_11129 [Fusarium longipes]
MTNYSLNVEVGHGVVRQLMQQGSRLCLAFGVENDGYKVIASSSNLGSMVSFQWKADFAVGASNGNFQNGVMSSTKPDPVRLGQTYTLTPDWQGSVNDGGRQGAIVFKNQNDRASPILYKNINGSNAPIYFGSHILPRGSSQEIKPNNRVAIWFQSEGRSGTMIDGIYDRNPFEIDMSGRTDASVVLNDNFTWSLRQ